MATEICENCNAPKSVHVGPEKWCDAGWMVAGRFKPKPEQPTQLPKRPFAYPDDWYYISEADAIFDEQDAIIAGLIKERDAARLDAEDKASIARIAVSNFEQAEEELDAALEEVKRLEGICGRLEGISAKESVQIYQLQAELDELRKQGTFDEGVEAAAICVSEGFDPHNLKKSEIMTEIRQLKRTPPVSEGDQ